MRWPKVEKASRVCGAAEVAAATMIAPESRKSGLAGLRKCTSWPEALVRVSRFTAGAWPLLVPLPPASTTITPSAVARRIDSQTASTISLGPSIAVPGTKSCVSSSITSPKARLGRTSTIESARLGLREATKTVATFGAKPTQPTVLSRAQSWPRTAVPCAREVLTMVPFSCVAPWAARSSWFRVQPCSMSTTVWPAPSPPGKPQA